MKVYIDSIKFHYNVLVLDSKERERVPQMAEVQYIVEKGDNRLKGTLCLNKVEDSITDLEKSVTDKVKDIVSGS
jgi:hypothetical protein